MGETPGPGDPGQIGPTPSELTDEEQRELTEEEKIAEWAEKIRLQMEQNLPELIAGQNQAAFLSIHNYLGVVGDDRNFDTLIADEKEALIKVCVDQLGRLEEQGYSGVTLLVDFGELENVPLDTLSAENTPTSDLIKWIGFLLTERSDKWLEISREEIKTKREEFIANHIISHLDIDKGEIKYDVFLKPEKFIPEGKNSAIFHELVDGVGFSDSSELSPQTLENINQTLSAKYADSHFAFVVTHIHNNTMAGSPSLIIDGKVFRKTETGEIFDDSEAEDDKSGETIKVIHDIISANSELIYRAVIEFSQNNPEGGKSHISFSLPHKIESEYFRSISLLSMTTFLHEQIADLPEEIQIIRLEKRFEAKNKKNPHVIRIHFEVPSQESG